MSEILVVDDERVIREGLKTILTGEGLGVRTAHDGEEALKKIAERRPDLVLLDVMMPKMNGFKCCESIRRNDPLLPVVFLTAKAAEADQVRGFGLGADDYIAKTADNTLLIARLARALARAKTIGAHGERGADPTITLGSVVVNLKTLWVVESDRESARLTRTECDLLQILAKRRGKPQSVNTLIDELRGKGFACEDNMLFVHICHLRRKLGKAGELITHKRNIGYTLA